MSLTDRLEAELRDEGKLPPESSPRPKTNGRSHDPNNPFHVANALDPAAVLDFVGMPHDGKYVAACPRCHATSGVEILSDGWRCYHGSCADIGKPEGFRSNVDTVMETRGVSAVEAVNMLSERFGGPKVNGSKTYQQHVQNDAPPNPFEGLVQTIPAEWLTQRPPARKWLLRRDGSGVVPLGKVGITIGSGGIGKTIANIGKAICVATGAPWLGFEPEAPGLAVLLLGEETADEVHRRIFHAARCMKLTQAQMGLAARNIIAVPLAGKSIALTAGDGRGNVSITPVRDQLVAMLEGLARPISLITIDPLSRWAGQEAETNNGAATRFIEVLEGLTELPGTPTIDCSHHKNKGGRSNTSGDVSDARGSTALTDGGRWAMNLEPDGPRAVVLSLSKANYSAPMDPILAIRDRMHGGALRLMTDEEAAEHEASKAKGAKRSIPDTDIDAAIVEALDVPQTSIRGVLDLLRGLKGAGTDRKQARLAYLVSQPDGPVEHVGGKYRRRER